MEGYSKKRNFLSREVIAVNSRLNSNYQTQNMENQGRKKIELKPVPLKGDSKLSNAQVQTRPLSKRDILSEEEVSEVYSKNQSRDRKKLPRQSTTSSAEQPQAPASRRPKRHKISKYPSFEFELEQQAITKLNQTPKEVRSIETMLMIMEAEYKGIDGFLKENPVMVNIITEFMGKARGRLENMKKLRIQQENAQAIEYQRPDRDHYQMRKNQTIHGLIREVEGKWAKKIEIQTRGFANRSYEQYLQLLKQKVSKEVQSVNFDQKKEAIENSTKQICEPNRVKYNQLKQYDETKLDSLAATAKKILRAKAHIRRIQQKLKKYMELKQAEDFGSRQASYLWSPSDYFVQFA